MQLIEQVFYSPIYERREFKGSTTEVNDVINVGIIGYGMMGKHHASVWSLIPNVRITAVAELVPERRDKAAHTYNLSSSEKYSHGVQMLNYARDLDVVIIASQAPEHHQKTLIAVERGCHVVCEKPMALTLEQCDEMVGVAEKKDVVLAIHHQSIFSRAFAEAKRQIISHEIGELQLLKAYGKGRIACSDLMEIAGHLVHGMRHLAGSEVTELYGDVTVQGRSIGKSDRTYIKTLYPEGRDSGYGAGDRILGFYKFANGMRAELQLTTLEGSPATFNEQRNFGYYIDVFGSKKRLQIYLPKTLLVNASPLDDHAKNGTPWEESYPEFSEDKDLVLTRHFAEDVIKAIREKRDPIVSGKDGRMAMEMTLGLYASHFAGRPLSVPLLDRAHPFD